MTSILVSAPGKIILFGEHAVVHGKTAIAASVGLRAYLMISEIQEKKIIMEFSDINLHQIWNLDDLPWDKVPKLDLLSPPKILDNEFLNTLISHIKTGNDMHDHASHAFLYIYMCISKGTMDHNISGIRVILRSSLPVGAGLGSSAAVSVSIASGLLRFFKVILHTSIPNSSKLINQWAYLGECVIHGKPSGIDNTVSTYGGAVVFKKGNMEILSLFNSIRFLLIDTGIKRNTKVLVENVGKKLEKFPHVIGPILDAIDGVALDCQMILSNTLLSRKDLLYRLEELIDLNHYLLSSLPVSHAAIESIREISLKEGVHVKLTGAGGGGCCVGLIHDDYPEEKVNQLKDKLQSQYHTEKVNFRCFETEIGERGVGEGEIESNINASSLLEWKLEKLVEEMFSLKWSYFH